MSGQSSKDDLADEEPVWETEIVDELLDMISREGESWIAHRIGDSKEDAECLEREFVFDRRPYPHTNRERKFGELPCPVGV
jgi:hypothetical protein